ncbi:hypothetical protein CDD82_3600 [Ophiocordyceps australis]|uniref:BZIP domain-containing protein n=1 Tax=Ophiocordyceps australis TaxID=1399860 RepID=A0A2C5ZBR8_9HYPO|nr:hypothetical protein CDD82_3600 [Ophiocordyceps australis]
MGSAPTNASSARGYSKSPKQTNNRPSPGPDAASASAPDSKPDVGATAESSSTTEAAKPLAPPPRPNQSQQQQQGANTPDYFAPHGGSLSLEPNPFEQSFGGGGPETPGGTKLPSVAALTSPSSLLPGSNATPFNWGGGSLRTGPLSPAMLSGPANDYFADTHHLRGGFPTPNESSLRTGLTPGGSGSMFPAPSPNSQAIFAQIASGGATPGTLDFHRTALSAAVKREQTNGVAQSTQQAPTQPQSQAQSQQVPQPQTQQPQQQSATSSTQDMPALTSKAEPKSAHGPFDPHDNDAANGLFMLAQGRNGSQSMGHYSSTSTAGHAHPASAASQNADMSPQLSSGNAGSIGSGRGVSEASNISDDAEPSRATNKGRSRKNTSTSNGRRKADEPLQKPSANKKTKSNNTDGYDMSDDEDSKLGLDEGSNGGPKTKMTEEDKRRNFLERNRVAALKCRQRKKQWLANLQNKVELFSSENDQLTTQITQLREEVVNLKTLLLAHKDCPVTQQQGLHGAFMSQVVEPYNAQMNPYGMAGTMSNQQVMAGQGVQRRYS